MSTRRRISSRVYCSASNFAQIVHQASRLSKRLVDEGRLATSGNVSCTVSQLEYCNIWVGSSILRSQNSRQLRNIDFISMCFRTQDFTVAPMPKMQIKVQSIINHWRLADTVSALDIHKMLGAIQYMAPLVLRGCFRFWLIQWWASEAWDQSSED